MQLRHSFYFLLSLFLLSFAVQAEIEVEIDYELDPYYSNIGIFIPINDKEIPTVELKNELQIYLALLKDALTPSFFVIELSANPLPILGVYLKEHQTSFYNDAQINDNLNLIEAFTEGFEEPYALSFFLGNVIKFTLPNKTESKAINKGFSGFLISIGDKHISANTLYDDQWMEIEWKLKGDRRIGDTYHSFSFRLGTKSHDHESIVSSYYFGLRREFFNSKVQDYGIFENIGIDFRIDFSQKTNNRIQSELFIDKRWPTSNGEISIGFGLKQIKNKYLNELSVYNQDVQLILRPSFKF